LDVSRDDRGRAPGADSMIRGRIPIELKVAYSAFVAVLVPYYWVTYTPWNFLYFCDVALVVTLVALWTESPLLVSMQAIGITVPQMIWVADLFGRLVFGVYLTKMTGYMFDPEIPVFVRALSSFHGWLPFLLLWLVWRLGYDRRALAFQTLVAVTLLAICYLAGPVPPPSAAHPQWAVNINYVYGMDDQHPQTSLPPALWVLCLLTILVVAFYVPTHLVLRRVFSRATREGA
jgi:hypothetical protein